MQKGDKMQEPFWTLRVRSYKSSVYQNKNKTKRRLHKSKWKKIMYKLCLFVLHKLLQFAPGINIRDFCSIVDFICNKILKGVEIGTNRTKYLMWMIYHFDFDYCLRNNFQLSRDVVDIPAWKMYSACHITKHI